MLPLVWCFGVIGTAVDYVIYIFDPIRSAAQ
jgi:predicted exporter